MNMMCGFIGSCIPGSVNNPNIQSFPEESNAAVL